MKSILVASPNKTANEEIRNAVKENFYIDTVKIKNSIISSFSKKRYDFLLIDLDYLKEIESPEGDNSYQSKLQTFRSIIPSVEIIVISTQEKIRDVVNAVKAGASNYLTYPIDLHELRYIIENIQDNQLVRSELDYLRDHILQPDGVELTKTNSPKMNMIINKVRRVAPTKSTILLLGETGTGKGVMARLIHQLSSRSNRQFISVHCGAISDTILESELFGHEKGAFTGAIRKKLGKFEIAHKGTIFLDEIGAVSASMQIKLLRVLQERVIERVGGEDSIEVDIRIIAATNSDLEQMSREGQFRRDLYFRLNVFPIEIPPLCERIEDIPLLVDVFLNRLNRLYSKSIKGIEQRVLDKLKEYQWPGNIRELENLIERAYILEEGHILSPDSFPADFFFEESLIETPKDYYSNLPLDDARKEVVDAFEHNYLKALLKENKGRINESAKAAGIGVRQLHKLMTKYGIRKEEYKKKEEVAQQEFKGPEN